ncbi:hypothetical protein ACVW1A_005539 [Bradyrhizobium sp. LB1.3]
MGEALLVAQLDACEVEHAVLHRGSDLLALAGMGTMIECGDDAERQMQTGAAVADLCAGDQWKTVAEAGGGGGAAGALRDVLIDLAVFVRSGTKALDRGDDHLRVDRLDLFPRETHAVEHAGAEVLDQHVALLDQLGEDFLALGVLGVERDRALVVVEHGEIQAVHVRDVLQLATGDVTHARTFHLDHVGAEPGQQLCAGRSGLDVGEVENANALKRLGHRVAPYSVCPCQPQGIKG